MNIKKGDIVKYVGPNSSRPIWGHNGLFIPGVVEGNSYYPEYWVKFQDGSTWSCSEKNLEILTSKEVFEYVDKVPPIIEDIKIPSIADLLKE